MAKSIKVEPQVIRGFEASIANVDLYKAVAEGSAYKFGKKSRAYKTIMNGIDTNKGTGSQYFFNTESGLYLSSKQRIIGYDDIGRINDADSTFFDGTFYADTNELVLRTANPTCESSAKILENLVKQAKKEGLEFSPKNPLILSNLELIGDNDSNNPYGILVKIGNKTSVRNDERFAYGNDEINLGNQSKTLWTREDGLSGVCFSRNGVFSNDDDLQKSNGNGRVVVFDAEGVASENSEFEAIKQKYHSDLSALRDKIDTKLKQ